MLILFITVLVYWALGPVPSAQYFVFLSSEKILNSSYSHCSVFPICYSLPVDRVWVFPLNETIQNDII